MAKNTLQAVGMNTLTPQQVVVKPITSPFVFYKRRKVQVVVKPITSPFVFHKRRKVVDFLGHPMPMNSGSWPLVGGILNGVFDLETNWLIASGMLDEVDWDLRQVIRWDGDNCGPKESLPDELTMENYPEPKVHGTIHIVDGVVTRVDSLRQVMIFDQDTRKITYFEPGQKPLEHQCRLLKEIDLAREEMGSYTQATSAVH